MKVKVWKCESESVKVKVWKWKCESESVKVKVWKCESVKVWKWKCESFKLDVVTVMSRWDWFCLPKDFFFAENLISIWYLNGFAVNVHCCRRCRADQTSIHTYNFSIFHFGPPVIICERKTNGSDIYMDLHICRTLSGVHQLKHL